jgi:DNA ligase (NAD+)
MKNAITGRYTKKNIDELAQFLKKNSLAYYGNGKCISNTEYDILTEHLRSLDPKHSLLEVVEEVNDVVIGGKKQPKVKHTTPMLSTEKAYTQDQLERFVKRVLVAAKSVGIEKSKVVFRMTPKLDGMAAKYENGIVVSRGDGKKGNDISYVLKRGVVVKGKDNSGPGEIVMKKSVFDKHFSDRVEHPRNLVTGVVNSDVLGDEAKSAIKKKSIHFVPFDSVKSWEGSAEKLLKNIDSIREKLIKKVDYPLDGVVIEVTDDTVKEKMGATNHHNRWQIALKTLGDTAETEIENIRWQTGRTGKITPVLEIKPVRLSGAMLSNVTAHHAGMVKDLCLGAGAKIEVIRSGEVIPKLLSVIKPCKKGEVITKCPSCSEGVTWQNDFLMCTNSDCSARKATSLYYWFKTLKSADGFGPKTIEVLVENGKIKLEDVYELQISEFEKMGFGSKQSKNLYNSLQTSLKTETEDAKFLAAFGIEHLGTGESRKLLSHYKLETLKDLSKGDISDIKGFGKKTSASIVDGMTTRWSTIKHMLDLGFVLQRTMTIKEKEELVASLDHDLVGKKVLFTGTMASGMNRDQMQDQARKLGIDVKGGYSKSLDYLVIGGDVGPGNGKFDKATTNGNTILSEAEYLKKIT